MEVIEDRHGRSATPIARQLPTELWHECIGEATLADAILDRTLHGPHRTPLIGESIRKRTAPLTNRDRSEQRTRSSGLAMGRPVTISRIAVSARATQGSWLTAPGQGFAKARVLADAGAGPRCRRGGRSSAGSRTGST